MPLRRPERPFMARQGAMSDYRAMATTSKQPRVVGYNVYRSVETKEALLRE